MYKVMLHKTFLFGWKRYGICAMFVVSAVFVTVGVIMWNNLAASQSPRVLGFAFRAIIPALMTYAQTTILDCLIVEIVGEKESKMKVVQLVNGVPMWIYWAQYLTYYTILSSLLSAIWTLVFCTTCMRGCNPLLVFLGVELIYLQSFGTSVVMATFFDHVKTASFIAQVLVFVNYVPIGLSYVPKLPHAVQYATGFLPGFGPVWWLQSVLTLKLVTQENWGWGASFATEITDEQIRTLNMPESFKVPPAGDLWLLLWLQVGLWLLLAYWLDSVWQGELGTAKPLTFCFQARYMCPRGDRMASDPEGRAVALEIANLRKVFRRGEREHVAVDGMSLEVRRGELFALLGHNGAGKTTVIHCITGIVPITSGTAHVMGYNCESAMDQCRWNLAICPQDSPIYDRLSVAQHLRFFAALRGSRDPAVEIPQILQTLGLEEKLDQNCMDLSGGQKRRLWVATALIGQAPVVFLDEPTSGMDPDSRRQLWDLLLDMKAKGRAIIFTTHYLEEADLLADRKAVLAEGKIQAMGTSMELKQHFGEGYNLQVYMAKGAPATSLDEIRRNVAEMVTGGARHAAREEGRDGSQMLVFHLPFGQVGSIGPLLMALEERAAWLDILHYDIAMTNLEEIFMALGKEAQRSREGAAQQPEAEPAPAHELELAPQMQSNRGSMAFKDMILTMFKLRLQQVQSQKWIIGFTLLFPVAFVLYLMASMAGFHMHRAYPMGKGFAIAPALACGLSATHLLGTVVIDRETKVLHTAISQGMHPSAYWAGTFLEAGLHTLLPALATPLFAQILSVEFMGQGRAILLWILAFLQPAPVILFVLLLSRSYTNPEVAIKTGLFPVLMLGVICLVPEMMWSFGPNSSTFDTTALLVHSLWSFLNPFYLSAGLITALWRAGGSPSKVDDFKWGKPPEGANFGYWLSHWSIWAPIVGQIVLSFVMAFFLTDTSARLLSRFCNRNVVLHQATEVRPQIDEDVLAEEERVRGIVDPAALACLYRNLHHTFHGRNGTAVPAVQGISLGIEYGEAFGLLGPNGAGKTTTLSCLTGEIRPPTSGEVYVAGKEVTGSDIFEAYKHLGFCPQVDPIMVGLSGRQHIAFFGRLKGVPERQLAQEVNRVMDSLGLDEADKDKRADKYSGGMKRKLSLGIAMIGVSNVLFLDEPSASVDAVSKRHLWRVIKQRASTQAVIITTHSMEEADAICDRIAIQVKGTLRCLGSSIHLRSKYGSGYELEVVLSANSVRPSSAISWQSAGELVKSSGQAETKEEELEVRQGLLMNFVQSQLSAASILLESHGNRFVFQFPAMQMGSLTFGQIFNRVHARREQLGIEACSVKRPSLEQVFLRFAQEQSAPAVDEGEQSEAQLVQGS